MFNQLKSLSQLRFEFNTVFIYEAVIFGLLLPTEMTHPMDENQLVVRFSRFETIPMIESIDSMRFSSFIHVQSEKTITSFSLHHLGIILFNGIDASRLS